MSYQSRDYIAIGGQKLMIKNIGFDYGRITYSPLHLLLMERGLLHHFHVRNLVPDQHDLRGYICEWEIKASMLYLTRFQSFSRTLNSMEQLTNESITTTQQRASTWFSGEINVVENLAERSGKTYHVHSGKIVGVDPYTL